MTRMQGDPNAGAITVHGRPGESLEDHIARIVAAMPPLTLEQKAELRAIFLPSIEADQARARAAREKRSP
ncbi:hypothetical protein [Streptomyces sp. NPDC020817]|uniref:hypothetical protein n=1 Tax=Streptomyces sp. NPDC020817 TaxID=3365095 RepID=UPI00379A5CE2